MPRRSPASGESMGGFSRVFRASELSAAETAKLSTLNGILMSGSSARDANFPSARVITFRLFFLNFFFSVPVRV